MAHPFESTSTGAASLVLAVEWDDALNGPALRVGHGARCSIREVIRPAHAGQQVRAPQGGLVLVVDGGEGAVAFGGVPTAISRGSVVVVGPLARFEIGATGSPLRLLVITLETGMLATGDPRLIRSGSWGEAGVWRSRRLVPLRHALLASRWGDHGSTRLDETSEALVLTFLETVRRVAMEPRRERPLWVELVHARLQTDYAEPPSVLELAAELGVDRRLLVREFTARFGMAPSDFVRLCRARVAYAALVDGQELVTHVARRVGFQRVRQLEDALRRCLGVELSRLRVGRRGPEAVRLTPC
jgi:AraC-like DNA-binding protein